MTWADMNFPAVTVTMRDNGLIRLTDPTDLDGGAVVDMHVLHVKHLAQRMGLLRADPDHQRIAKLEAWIYQVRDRIEDLHALLASVPCFPPSATPTDDVRMSLALLELVDGYIADIEAAKPFANPSATVPEAVGLDPAGKDPRISGETPPGTGLLQAADVPTSAQAQLELT